MLENTLVRRRRENVVGADADVDAPVKCRMFDTCFFHSTSRLPFFIFSATRITNEQWTGTFEAGSRHRQCFSLYGIWNKSILNESDGISFTTMVSCKKAVQTIQYVYKPANSNITSSAAPVRHPREAKVPFPPLWHLALLPTSSKSVHQDP